MNKDQKKEISELCLDIIDELEVVVDYLELVGYEGPKYDAILCAGCALNFLARELREAD